VKDPSSLEAFDFDEEFDRAELLRPISESSSREQWGAKPL
jgi:hypothetical protein